jgi:protein arginine N-methyltransferase 1
MLQEHLGYVADAVRLERYRAAIGKAVRPGDRVADLGCGAGVLGLLCMQAGAAHVDFVDESDMIEVARETVARAGLRDRAAFIRGRSQHVELPQPVDAVVCDHVGFFGFDYGVVELLQDAKRRFLKPGGALIPRRVTLQVAAIASEKCRALAEGWTAPGIPGEFHWLREYSLNTKHAVDLAREDPVSAPVALGTIDASEEQPEFFSWTAELRIGRDGVVHGLGGWFECELAAGVKMTNSPLVEQPIKRSQVFLPAGAAVPVKAGDLLEASVMARPADHVIAWTLAFPAAGQRFSHSTLRSMLLSQRDLIAADPARVPTPNREGRARASVLAYCDGKRTAREIEQAVLRDHPGLFPSTPEISRFVARVLGSDTA